MVDEDGKAIKGANPNSRFTAPIMQCPSASELINDTGGVPISAIVFGGRRASLAPLVYQSFDWQHGVFVGSIMASEITAAQYGAQGKTRRDPMAMIPFCGYNMGDYFTHWLKMGKKMKNQPKIFHVNWFRTNKEGEFLWPGFSDNLRVIEWIIERCKNKIGAVETPIGHVPHKDDIDLDGMDIDDSVMEQLLNVPDEEWKQEIAEVKKFYEQFGDRLPDELKQEIHDLEKRLNK